ncbi:MAG TPA: SigE family RNA polymerase sigma factor [Marmoricola sp.]|nr:SigE family RNA polymerase sigma factor [Marmoricola sp.]
MKVAERDDEFADFVRIHRPSLVGMARLLTAGDTSEAEDVVQTALARMYVSWGRVRRADNQLGYARTTLTHVFIDETRRAHRRRESPVADPRIDGPADQPDFEMRTAIAAALAGLAPSQRAVVVLRHWLDLSVAETAHILGCSTGNVKSQNSRALEHLREVLGPAMHLTTKESR